MFEFFIFQAGGLVLWPIDAESSKSNGVVNEYIQKRLLEGKSTTDEKFVRDKTICTAHHDTENNLFFIVTVHQQVAQQISYLKELLVDVATKFLTEYKNVLARTDIMLIPTLFASFSVEDVINKYRGTVGSRPTTPPVKFKVEPKKQRKDSPSSRPRHTDKKEEDPAAISVVVGSKEAENVEKVEIKPIDLNTFDGIFAPSQNQGKSFFSGILKGIVGEKYLDKETIQPFLEKFETHLISKNVASTIASELTKAVSEKLEGTKCGTFASVKNIVSQTLREHIGRILTPHRSLDVIRDIQQAKAAGHPYVISFVGVNGVGKSTTLAKVAYLFKSHGFKVMITACDTFRSGAIDQLDEHAKKLDIELFQRGGSRRDPVPVARESIQYAKERDFDVVLIDTAGRMQNSEGLMRQIARLINEVRPDLTLFVAEALVGNNGSDQIQSFDSTLKRYGGGPDAKGIDGIVLTKFDTIDDKVGAALTLVYETGHPIIYLGVGQTYRDLRRMNPEFVVNTLLDGF